MEIKVRTWNMNYWKKRQGNEAKSKEEINEWIKLSKELILNDKNIDLYILQESSMNILANENILYKFIDYNNILNISYNNKNFAFCANPYKYLNWGLLTISKNIEGSIYTYNNSLAYMSHDFDINNNRITILNIHLQKDFHTKKFYPSFIKLITEIKSLLKDKNEHPIILMGDFNASEIFPSDELENFKDVFLELKKIGFIDCTGDISVDNRSTMLDYPYQNDYVFINESFKNIIHEIKIRKDIETEHIDHYPIDIIVKI